MIEVWIWRPTRGWKLLKRFKKSAPGSSYGWTKAIDYAKDFLPLELKVTNTKLGHTIYIDQNHIYGTS